jgi:hypothetical protein
VRRVGDDRSREVRDVAGVVPVGQVSGIHTGEAVGLEMPNEIALAGARLAKARDAGSAEMRHER